MINIKVKLVQWTDNPVKLLADIASICYGKEEASNPEKLVRNLNALEHHSVFEHAHYTFYIKGISRACLAQLTRHRHASYTVRSQRYCDESEQEFLIPIMALDNQEQLEVIRSTLDIINSSYKNLIKSGVKREDARAILPQATATDLYMTCNLRELLHIYKLRTDTASQREIQDLLYNMANEVLDVNPELEFLFEKGEE